MAIPSAEGVLDFCSRREGPIKTVQKSAAAALAAERLTRRFSRV